VLVFLAATGCDRDSAPPATAHDETPTPTNRIDINAAVRQNLGITFATVESRHVSRTLRVPGRFELLPSALREYRAAVPGTVELLVEQFQSVERGDPLYRLDSPRWRQLQGEIADAEAAVRLARAAADSIEPLLAAHEHHHEALENAATLWAERVEELERLREAGGARVDEIAQARASLATARAELAETLEKEAELLARRTESAARLDAAVSRRAFLLQAAANLAGVSAERLAEESNGSANWRSIGAIEVRANAPGVVQSVDTVSGAIIDEQTPVLTTVQPGAIRFRALALQSDLPRLSQGQPAMVVPTQSQGGLSPLSGALTLAPTADPERRTIELLLAPAPGESVPSWARAGVSAFLEVVTSGTDREELAIPLRCVARDGTQAIIFRRDPTDPNKAIRMEADLGIDDGRWVVIKSGVAEGNEVVLDGVYQLMVATSGTLTKGGHFHPDGTFHEGDD